MPGNLRKLWISPPSIMRSILCIALVAASLFRFAPAAPAASARMVHWRSAAPHAASVEVRSRRKRPEPAAARRKSLATLDRTRRKPLHLHPAEPVTTALIDPVPRGRFVFPPPLRGSHDSLLRQNARSSKDGLKRIQDDADLLDLRRAKELVAIPATAALRVDTRLPSNRRYCRPWTAQFLSDLSRVHYGRFHRALQVNSAVRTVAYQRRLGLVNENAAPADGDDASPHLTGATVDIAKKGLSTEEIGWLRAYLMPLGAAGKVDVEEEFYQACFHITVYRSYRSQTEPPEAHDPVSPGRGGNAALLATRLP
jgi:hypothetical protein